VIRSFPVVAFAAASLVALAACGGGSGSAAETAPPRGSVVLTTGHAQSIGTVLATGAGDVLYATAGEAHGKLHCTGNCVDTWPVLTVTSKAAIHLPRASPVQQALISTIAGSGTGRVVTYAGYPLHTYAGDAAGSAGNGEGIQNYFAIGVDGRLVQPPAKGTPTP
jgi:predicted lipoprotein with Yx(FWY)xxD motif